MGNCQAADAATVVIQHRDGRLEKACWSLPATQVMAANPGHYVAAMLTSNARRPSPSTSHHQRRKPAVTYLKLLRPDETLLIGHVYLLVSFEEVLREFASKRHVRLSRLLAKQEEKASSSAVKGEGGYKACTADPDTVRAQPEEHKVEAEVDKELEEVVQDMMTRSNMSSSSGAARHGQWKPALESIAEVGEQVNANARN